ncbi:MAG: hypothetical protein KAS32_11735 [Candidatus Peribacteraceae bacterium]|nr:hypothetical protein [Candidatus Peribacteraceae bacterium]
MKIKDKTDKVKNNIVDIVNCNWSGISWSGLFALMEARKFGKESEIQRKVWSLVDSGLIRLDVELLRPGCDVLNPHEHLRNKIKVYKGRSSECGQWLISTDVEGLVSFLTEDITAYGLEYFDSPYSISYEIVIDWMDQDEFDNMGEFDGC